MSIQVIKTEPVSEAEPVDDIEESEEEEPDNETEPKNETEESTEEARIQKMWTQAPSFTEPIPSLFRIKQGENWSYKLPVIK